VLRSFGKAYGLAGVRLGFAIASPDVAAPLRAALGSWPVSGAAISIGRAALADDAWLDRMRGWLAREAARLDRLLRGAGAEILGGTPLFRLVRHGQAHLLFSTLLEQAILTRPFDAFPDRLRVGLPAGPTEWRRLEIALSRFRDVAPAKR
jgi:cobalamin biosynthetic protein CobC